MACIIPVQEHMQKYKIMNIFQRRGIAKDFTVKSIHHEARLIFYVFGFLPYLIHLIQGHMLQF